jgi:hypothetical protein
VTTLDDKLAEAAGNLRRRALAGETVDTLGPDLTAMMQLARDASDLGTGVALAQLLGETVALVEKNSLSDGFGPPDVTPPT